MSVRSALNVTEARAPMLSPARHGPELADHLRVDAGNERIEGVVAPAAATAPQG